MRRTGKNTPVLLLENSDQVIWRSAKPQGRGLVLRGMLIALERGVAFRAASRTYAVLSLR